MQTVKYVMEELSRFNPDARMNPELDIQGVSPATQCDVGIVDSDEIKELREENKRIGKECDDYESENDDLRQQLHNAERVLNDKDLTDRWKLIRIAEALKCES